MPNSEYINPQNSLYSKLKIYNEWMKNHPNARIAKIHSEDGVQKINDEKYEGDIILIGWSEITNVETDGDMFVCCPTVNNIKCKNLSIINEMHYRIDCILTTDLYTHNLITTNLKHQFNTNNLKAESLNISDDSLDNTKFTYENITLKTDLTIRGEQEFKTNGFEDQSLSVYGLKDNIKFTFKNTIVGKEVKVKNSVGVVDKAYDSMKNNILTGLNKLMNIW